MAHADARGAVTARALVGDVDGSGIRSVRTTGRQKNSFPVLANVSRATI